MSVTTRRGLVLAIISGLCSGNRFRYCSVVSFKRDQQACFCQRSPTITTLKKGWAEPTIVIRFWIISIILALIGLATLKLRPSMIAASYVGKTVAILGLAVPASVPVVLLMAGLSVMFMIR